MKTRIVFVSVLHRLRRRFRRLRTDRRQRSRRQGDAHQIRRHPTADSKPGHFKVSSGATYLKTGVETEVPENRNRALAARARRCCWKPWSRTARRRIQQPGITWAGSICSRATWSGRTAAFTKAEALMPACKKDISETRYIGWVPLVNAGIDFAKKQNNDSALALFRQANTIYRDKPLGLPECRSHLRQYGPDRQRHRLLAEGIRDRRADQHGRRPQCWRPAISARCYQQAGRHQDADPGPGEVSRPGCPRMRT